MTRRLQGNTEPDPELGLVDYFSHENNQTSMAGWNSSATGFSFDRQEQIRDSHRFAYDPFRTGKWSIRGGYGIYRGTINFLTPLREERLRRQNIGRHVTFNPGGIAHQ